MAAIPIENVHLPVAGTAPGWSIGATPATLCRLALWAFALILVTRTAADPDLWGHLRFGLDMLASKSAHAADQYSFTADRAWINHEWLSELLMAIGYARLGALGLNLLKLAVVAIVGGIALVIARQEHANPIARDLYVVLTVVATYTRTQVVRPQMFSVAICCVMLYLLRQIDRGHTRAIWYVPLLFAAWVNLHGGWIVGLAVLGVWMLGDAWQRRRLRWTLVLAAVGALVVVTTLVNPYGVGLWRFLAETVGLDRPDVTDWKPLRQLPPSVLVVESILPLMAMAAIRRGRAWRHLAYRDLAVLLLLVAATYRVGRVDAFLQAAIAILLATPIIAFLNGIDLSARGPFRRPSAAVGAIAVILALYAAATALSSLRVIEVGGPWVPDRAAAAFLRANSPGARVLTWFDWGEYALWQLSPSGIRVSMDGRRETLYSARVIRDHDRFYHGEAEMLDYPERIGADVVWLPSRLPVIEPLKSRGWMTLLDTGQSVILRRGAGPIATQASTTRSGPDLFPWP
jgi:hypothetical protein